ncbi:putative protein kinase RLK-Pelle-SD-2b family [Helianthus debilis subsp. tardiflorus]
MGLGIRRRLTLDSDGNLRLYSLNESSGLWSISWQAITGDKPECSCPPGYMLSDPADLSQGCKPTFNMTCSGNYRVNWHKVALGNQLLANLEDGYRVMSGQFRGFSYKELVKATQNFKVEIGRGGSGVVYKGVLDDKRVVAVKRLGDVSEGGELWTEVSTIANMNHMHVVRMWGFCSQKQSKLLVYEYVENLSLDKRLFSLNFLQWKERFQVAIGIAKGLAYLHHECLEWVIHCDVKPENILLDGALQPKIADFGLAKLSGQNSKLTVIIKCDTALHNNINLA